MMPMSDTHPVLTDISDGLATLTLNKPAKLNAWDTPMRAEIATNPQELERGWQGAGGDRHRRRETRLLGGARPR
jgi:enoyl-CoA hydratase/carnithine racemase